jgi:hypothetical protein
MALHAPAGAVPLRLAGGALARAPAACVRSAAASGRPAAARLRVAFRGQAVLARRALCVQARR